MPDLKEIYRRYIDCLNTRDLDQLGDFVRDDVIYNDKKIGLTGYRAMLEKDYNDIPDLKFNIGLLVSDESYIVCRLDFECTPSGIFLGLPVNGKKVTFTENVFYKFHDGKIAQVWSLIDKVAIEKQL